METSPPSEFWDFSVEVYARPEVSKLCLELQNNYGTDINMLLFACWLGQSGRGAVSVAAWRAMILRINKWREEVIKPLRKLRHLLRHEQLAPKDMKEQIFQCELQAEHVEQSVLEREWGSTRRPLVSGSSQRTRDMIHNLATYLKAENIPFDSKLVYRIERLVKQVSGLLDDKFIQLTCAQAMQAGRESDESRQNLTMP